MINQARKIVSDSVYRILRDIAHLLRFWAALGHSKKLREVCFVGITGSAGKTTAKDLSAEILRTAGECYSSPRSLNYPDGIAKILFKVRRRHKFCVLEVSGAKPGELDRPLRLFTPKIAVLTLVARDHFKAFKSVDAIAEEKSKLIAALPADGVAVLNIDDPQVRSIGKNCNRRVIWVGEAEGATLRTRSARSQWPEPLTLEVEYEGDIFDVRTSFHGKHLSLSVVSALGVGLAAGIPLADAISAVADVQPAEGRMEITQGADGVTFVRDDWKAPHWSLSAPLEFMREANARRKVIVIGTLSDYSLSASKLYPKVARQALEIGNIVVFVGPHALRTLKAKRGGQIRHLHAFSEIREAAGFLADALKPGDLVLLKGSNKADHLVRLVYDRQKPVQCWVPRCGIQDFCGDCPRLYRPPVRQAEDRLLQEGGAMRAPLTQSGGGNAKGIVIVGLGNSGSQFDNTPHNAGYCVLDRLVTGVSAEWSSEPEGLICEMEIAGRAVILLKPKGKINHSGPPTRQLLERIGAGLNDCIIIHDEIDLPLGQAKLKHGGGDGGHKGLKSIIAALGSGEVLRLRVGVKRETDKRDSQKSVLERFSSFDSALLRQGGDRAVELVQAAVVGAAPSGEKRGLQRL